MKNLWKKSIAIGTAALLGVSVLAGCSAAPPITGTASGGTDNAANTDSGTAAEAATSAASTGEYTKKDLDGGYEENGAVSIQLGGTSIAAQSGGVAVDGSTATITAAGTYILSGTLADGQVIVDAGEADDVKLVLDGAELNCSDGPAIYVKQADKVILTLAEGTTNTVSDGAAYADVSEEAPNAAIFSTADLSINGTGALTVNGNYNNGVSTKDDLVITGGDITVTAANHGFRGHDSVSVLDGNITINAGSDGIQSDQADDAEKGWIILDGGTFSITAGNDGIQAETTLTVNGGTYDIVSGGGSANAEQKSNEGGGWQAQASATETTSSESYKGIKAGTALTVNGGAFTMDCADDTVHSNGNADINGGTFALSTGDDGVHADADLTVNADITISTCYEGLEGANITIHGGIISIASSDDGLNAAGGSDESTTGLFGQDRFSGGGDNTLTINGGAINMVCGGDGVDSNGDLNLAGGNVVVLINSSPDNGAMDCDGTFNATGGTIVYGGTGTGSNPGGSSSQSYVYFDSGVTAGTEYTLQKDGQALLAFTPSIDCQYLAISSPDITSGDTYGLYSGSSEIATATAGTGGGGMMGGGQGGEMRGDPGGGRGQRLFEHLHTVVGAFFARVVID